VVYFLAAPHRGQPIENPRQKSAYHYPLAYGPVSPVFCRAMFANAQNHSFLFISGTASIVGDETRHLDQPNEQIAETIRNLRVVMEQTHAAGWDFSNPRNKVWLKGYLRDAASWSVVKEAVANAFGPQAKAIYFQAEICRSNLLLEIEVTYQTPRSM
jgi:hypothetical protein